LLKLTKIKYLIYWWWWKPYGLWMACTGGVGISNIVHRMERHQYMGFESLCKV
jgi:hypothetical protein